MNISKLETFNEEPVTFVETQNIKSGVVCDVYSFDKDGSKDLGVVTVSKGSKTPLQKVIKGDKTIEGFLSGSGTLTITKEGGEIKKYDFSNLTPKNEVEVAIGQTMQWEASQDLVFYEICYPPYKDGRFKNIS